jgi:sulfur-oxidizing protein SoxZ
VWPSVAVADVPGVQPIRIRARVKDGITDVLILMPHPMETGLRKDATGDFVPAHFITDVHVTAAGRTVLQARMSMAVSQDPMLSFRFRGGRSGESVSVHWTDNRGQQRSDSTFIA